MDLRPLLFNCLSGVITAAAALLPIIWVERRDLKPQAAAGDSIFKFASSRETDFLAESLSEDLLSSLSELVTSFT